MNNELEEKIKQYIDKTEGEFYPDDISRALNIDFQKTMDICQKLINEEIIEITSWKVETLNKIPREKIVMDALFRFKDPIGFNEAKVLLGITDDELHKMMDNYEYKPTLEDIRIVNQEEMENTNILLEEWHKDTKGQTKTDNEQDIAKATDNEQDIANNEHEIDLVEELKCWTSTIDVESIDEVLEFLVDQGCLNEKGKDLRYKFWERYIKAN